MGKGPEGCVLVKVRSLVSYHLQVIREKKKKKKKKPRGTVC